MSSATVWSTRRLQTQPRTPSPSTLQVSSDGQLLLVGDQDLSIFVRPSPLPWRSVSSWEVPKSTQTLTLWIVSPSSLDARPRSKQTPDPDFASRPASTSRELFEVKTTSIHTALSRIRGGLDEDGSPPPQGADDDELKRAASVQDARLVEMKLARIAVPERTIAWERTESHDFRILNTGARVVHQEVSWAAAAWSPSTLSSLGGCMVAGLTSSNEVILFEAERDPLVGSWTAVDNITKKLLEKTQFPTQPMSLTEPVQDQIDYEVRRVYDAQTTCLAWSSQPSKRSPEAGLGDLSLLALGGKGGIITLWQWTEAKSAVCVGRGRVEDSWISAAAWSDWELMRDGTVQAALSYSTRAGAVKVLVVKRDASGEVHVDEPRVVAEADERPLTALKWVSSGLLAWAKAGEVHLAHVLVVPVSNKGKGKASAGLALSQDWEGRGRWRLKRYGSWPGSSRLATCCGIQLYGPTSVCFSLADGSHHVVTLAEESTDLAEAAYDLPLSRYLTTEARQLFEATEKPMEDASHPLTQAGARVLGCYRYDGCWAWVQQPTWDYDLSYFSSAKKHVTLLLAEIPVVSGTANALALDRIVRALDGPPTNYLLESPLASLFPSYLPFYLPDGRSPLHALSQEILDVVYPPPPPETPRASTSTSAPAGFDAAKLWFRKGLREDLWGSPATGGGRASSGLLKRLGMAEFFAERNGPHKAWFAQLQDELSKLVLIDSAVIILGWVARVKEFIRHDDDNKLLTLLTHVVLTALLRPSPSAPYSFKGEDLAAVTGQIFDLSVALQLDLFVNLEVLEAAMTGDEPMVDDADGEFEEKAWYTVNIGERCPACGEGINFDDVEGACCSNGHEWGRCSLTFGILTSAQCRRCLHCARPTLLQPSSRFCPRPLPIHPPPPPPPPPAKREVAAEEEADMELDGPPPRPTDGGLTPPPAQGPSSPTSTVTDVNMRHGGRSDGGDSDSDEDVHVTLHVHNGGGGADAPGGLAPADGEDVKPNVAALNAGGAAWLAGELLESATCCLYCGGRFALAL